MAKSTKITTVRTPEELAEALGLDPEEAVKRWEKLQAEEAKRRENMAMRLTVALRRSQAEFLETLKLAADDIGGVRALAEQTGLSREALYKALSARGDPRLSTVLAVLKALGLKIMLEWKR